MIKRYHVIPFFMVEKEFDKGHLNDEVRRLVLRVKSIRDQLATAEREHDIFNVASLVTTYFTAVDDACLAYENSLQERRRSNLFKMKLVTLLCSSVCVLLVFLCVFNGHGELNALTCVVLTLVNTALLIRQTTEFSKNETINQCVK